MDLIKTKEEYIRFNSLGNSPYGDVFQSLKNLIDDTILTINPSDGDDINERLISRLTKSQSNISSGIILAVDVFGTKTDLVIGGLKGVLEFKSSDTRIENIDTVGHP